LAPQSTARPSGNLGHLWSKFDHLVGACLLADKRLAPAADSIPVLP
jgi:hypothetical protein